MGRGLDEGGNEWEWEQAESGMGKTEEKSTWIDNQNQGREASLGQARNHQSDIGPLHIHSRSAARSSCRDAKSSIKRRKYT